MHAFTCWLQEKLERIRKLQADLRDPAVEIPDPEAEEAAPGLGLMNVLLAFAGIDIYLYTMHA